MNPEDAGQTSSSSKPKQSADQGMIIFSNLLAGLVLYGGLGWLVDHFLHTSYFLMIGLLIGMFISFYLIIKRYGKLS